jgi:hypothetical protein
MFSPESSYYQITQEDLAEVERIAADTDSATDRPAPSLVIFPEFVAVREDPKEALRAKLIARAFCVDVRPTKPAPILSFQRHVVGTAGNLLAVQGPVKVGKTGVVDSMIAAGFNGDLQSGADTLGIEAVNREFRAFLHFDSEQSRYDHDSLIRRALRRAKVDSPPAWFGSFTMADLSTKDRRAAVELAIEDAAASLGGVFIVLIDGVADLLADPNDGPEAFELVGWLHALAIRFDCCVVCVLHENPGSEAGKTRGHLGSQLSRKAESSLRLAKDSDGITTLWVTDGRSCDIPKSKGLCFGWSDTEGMHRTIGPAGSIKQIAERKAHSLGVDACFIGTDSMSYTALVERICEVCDVKDRAAKGRVTKWAALGLILKTPSGDYRPASENEVAFTP